MNGVVLIFQSMWISIGLPLVVTAVEPSWLVSLQLVNCVACTEMDGVGSGHSNINALFLVDPVDGDGKHAHGPKYPSAVAALKDKNFKMAIAGPTIIP